MTVRLTRFLTEAEREESGNMKGVLKLGAGTMVIDHPLVIGNSVRVVGYRNFVKFPAFRTLYDKIRRMFTPGMAWF